MEPPPEGPGPWPLGDIIVLGVCLLSSAFFSGTETALTALSDRRTRQLIDEGDRFSPVLQAWLDRPTRMITTLLVGNNLVNILGSVLAARIAHHFLDSYADAAAVGAMTLIVLVFGEVTPKTFAKHNPEKIAVPAMYLVRVFEVLFLPLGWGLAAFGKALVRLVGGKDRRDGPSVTEGDIEYMIELGAKEGVFEEETKGDLLHSAVEFGDVIAKEIMVPRTQVHFLKLDDTFEEAMARVVEWGHSRIPVYRETIDQVTGVLYAKDLLKVAARDPEKDPEVRHLIRRNLLFVPETQRVAETLREMRLRRQHLGIVLDEFGGTAGLITIEDILEELVGEIRDEYDQEEDQLRQLEEGQYVADAGISVFDMGEELGVEIPDDGEYETLGGFLTSALGRVPEVGAEHEHDSLRFRVVAANERRVRRVRIERIDPASLDGESGEEAAVGDAERGRESRGE